MSTDRLAPSLENMTAAVGRLGEALTHPETAPLAVDGTIQRFEFALETSWKALEHALAEEGMASSTPREAVGKALQAGWIADEDAWRSMLRDCFGRKE